jgi:predicted outer membrane protein
MSAPPQTTTVVTGAEVPASPPVASDEAASPAPTASGQHWSDGDIVAALRTAQAGREEEAKYARTRSKSVRVDRFAEDILQDERELTRDEAGLMFSVGSTTSPLEAQVADARRDTAVAAIGASGPGFDRAFLASEIRYERALLRLLENEMLPSARAAELRRFLQRLHTKTAKRIMVAQDIASQLP